MIVILKNENTDKHPNLSDGGILEEPTRYKTEYIISYAKVIKKTSVYHNRTADSRQGYVDTIYYGVCIETIKSTNTHYFKTKEDRDEFSNILDDVI